TASNAAFSIARRRREFFRGVRDCTPDAARRATENAAFDAPSTRFVVVRSNATASNAAFSIARRRREFFRGIRDCTPGAARRATETASFAAPSTRFVVIEKERGPVWS